MENIIECRNLTHYYGSRKIYEDLSFSVPKGRILGLLGKNGTGKTTSINILSGYLKPKAGECLIFGENIQTMAPELRRNIGLLIEGHVQYQFMNIEQIERFYSSFYPKWKKEAYYDLMSRLKVAPRQKISRMSCGQRSQVALGLILAQNPDLLILDDFSLGLDPGYRRLFVDFLKDYASSEEKTVFLTSHIIQDMERLIDDCIIMDYGKILTQQPVDRLLKAFRQITCTLPEGFRFDESGLFSSSHFTGSHFYNPAQLRNQFEVFSFLPEQEVRACFDAMQFPYSEFQSKELNLEDAFIGLTGKY
ncbi:MAG: ABC transporter ATP-binding protein [Bacteroidales bacterium]